MTEYEVADLAFSQIMQFQGAGALFQGIVDSSADLVQQFMTVLFAYLAAAHFVGASLNRVHVLIFTSLYVLWQSWTIALHTLRGYSMRVTLEHMREIGGLERSTDRLTEFMPQLIGILAFILLVGALIASLYFMWSIRHPKTESHI